MQLQLREHGQPGLCHTRHSGKVELQSTIDRGNLRKILGIHGKKVDPHREEPLLGWNAHSARYGESIHDRTVKLVLENFQEQAYLKISSWEVMQRNL